MNHNFEPTEGFPDDCAVCCAKHRKLSAREEHVRKVELMLKGAFDSPVFACWPEKEVA